MAYGKTEQVGHGSRCRARGYRSICKRYKARAERRQAKRDPECQPTYGRYRGWQT